MAYTQENIIVGAADVFIGPIGTIADPADVPSPVANAAGNLSYRAALWAEDEANDSVADGWKHVGLTTGGVEFTYAPDFGEVDVDQFLDVAKMFKQGQSVTVNTTFAEATLENLLFTWGQPTRTLTGGNRLAISGGSLGDKPEERALAFVGQAPDPADERIYVLERVLSVESSSFSLSKTESSTIPVSLRCLPVGDLSGDVEYGYILDHTYTTAP